MTFTRTIRVVLIAGVLALGGVMGVAPTSAQTYSNCAALNADYPHGVGKPGAVDSTSGRPVSNFEIDASVYSDNTSRDRDNDGIACEKK
ncbi:excalibur calcium-binding domain-containing protein [Williamsia herbipolensis]|uniref:excalibur calcium-binding domain-containing protein n=1 Tax=Williamsia herbipolensis TaxID=1603258 RepID=UPI0005F79980|nr:excalibur calcium-binding domain-containing protein [Williamsia herbipolensis]